MSSDVLLKSMKDMINKHLTETMTTIKDFTSMFEKKATATIKDSHSLQMAAVENLVSLTESKLLNIHYLRHSTLRDPSLKEGGCKHVHVDSTFQNSVKAMFQAMIHRPRQDTVPLDLLVCNQTDCSLKETLAVYFIKKRVKYHNNIELTQLHGPVIVACCQRHQYILENMNTITIYSCLTRKYEDNIITFNLVYNGFYRDNPISNSEQMPPSDDSPSPFPSHQTEMQQQNNTKSATLDAMKSVIEQEKAQLYAEKRQLATDRASIDGMVAYIQEYRNQLEEWQKQEMLRQQHEQEQIGNLTIIRQNLEREFARILEEEKERIFNQFSYDWNTQMANQISQLQYQYQAAIAVRENQIQDDVRDKYVYLSMWGNRIQEFINQHSEIVTQYTNTEDSPMEDVEFTSTEFELKAPELQHTDVPLPTFHTTFNEIPNDGMSPAFEFVKQKLQNTINIVIPIPQRKQTTVPLPAYMPEKKSYISDASMSTQDNITARRVTFVHDMSESVGFTKNSPMSLPSPSDDMLQTQPPRTPPPPPGTALYRQNTYSSDDRSLTLHVPLPPRDTIDSRAQTPTDMIPRHPPAMSPANMSKTIKSTMGKVFDSQESPSDMKTYTRSDTIASSATEATVILPDDPRNLPPLPHGSDDWSVVDSPPSTPPPSTSPLTTETERTESAMTADTQRLTPLATERPDSAMTAATLQLDEQQPSELGG